MNLVIYALHVRCNLKTLILGLEVPCLATRADTHANTEKGFCLNFCYIKDITSPSHIL